MIISHSMAEGRFGNKCLMIFKAFGQIAQALKASRPFALSTKYTHDYFRNMY